MGGLTWDIRHGNAIDVLRAMACECGAAVEPCTVLDPFNGSGTSGVVAVRNNRRYIGIELDVAHHKTGAVSKCLTRDFNADLVDGGDIFGRAVAGQGDAVAAKCVGDNAIRAGVGVAFLNGDNLLRPGQIPPFAGGAVFEAGEHELCPHRPIANEAAFQHCLAQQFLHNVISI